MKIVKVKLSDISPYYNNPRDNTNAVGPVIESFKRFGFIKPIICDSKGVIIAGHTRYIAAYQLGMEFVPVIYSEMSEEQAKMFRIADNKLSEKSEFDEDALIEELRKMKVPKDMQAFFFEDIDTMLNFSIESFQQQAEEYGGFDDFDSQEAPGDVFEEGDNRPTVTEDEGEQEEDPADNLFKVQKREDGTYFMKVVCPYCGNIETIDIEY